MPLPTPSVNEQYDRRASEVNADGSITATRVFRVEYPEAFDACTNAEKDEVDTHVLASVSIARWSAYPGKPAVLAQTAGVSNGGSQRIWFATYGYSDKFDGVTADGGAAAAQVNGAADGLEVASSGAASGPAGGDMTVNAESRPMTIRTIKRTVQEPLEYDQDTGYRITNTAGDPFDPPPMVEKTLGGYEVVWYVTAADLRWATPGSPPPYGRPDYEDTLNDAVFKIFGREHAIGSLRVAKVEVSQVWDKGGSGTIEPIHELRAELLHKPGGWKRNILNAGLREKNSSAEPLRPILDSAGQPVSEPYPLNSSGAKLAAGAALVYVTAWEYPKKNLIELFQ